MTQAQHLANVCNLHYMRIATTVFPSDQYTHVHHDHIYMFMCINYANPSMITYKSVTKINEISL